VTFSTCAPVPESDYARTLLDAWGETLARRHREPAILTPTGEVARSFLAVESEAKELAHRWRGHPVRSVVAVRIGNSPSWPAVFLALLRCGHVTVPLASDASAPPLADILIGPDLNLHPVPRSECSARVEVPPSTVLLKLTSGTTGIARAIRFTAEQLAADCHHICETMGITHCDLNFAAIPLSHSYGFSNLITPLLIYGVPMVVTDDRFPRAMHAAMEQTGATVFPGTPIFFQHLVDLPVGVPRQLRLCISAGAPLSMAVWEKFKARFGLGIHVFYGSSECGGIAFDRDGVLRCDGFVGQPMSGVSVRVCEEANRIEVRSAAVGEGYFPDEDLEVLSDGRFVPGDLARLDESGLVLAGRASEFINIGGRKLNPVEVEQRLSTLPGVRQVVVFGVPSAQRGEEPVACVAGEGIDPASLLKEFARALPPWQVPRDIWVVAELPVNERGKISRRTLAERYLSTRESG
jgi:acyl-CoA synthetase (AMP-forming)/AMP-acid ligase II